MLQFIPTALTLDSGVTRPPPLLSEADLLSCMDKVRKLEFQLFLLWHLALYASSLFSHNCILNCILSVCLFLQGWDWYRRNNA